MLRGLALAASRHFQRGGLPDSTRPFEALLGNRSGSLALDNERQHSTARPIGSGGGGVFNTSGSGYGGGGGGSGGGGGGAALLSMTVRKSRREPAVARGGGEVLPLDSEHQLSSTQPISGGGSVRVLSLASTTRQPISGGGGVLVHHNSRSPILSPCSRRLWSASKLAAGTLYSHHPYAPNPQTLKLSTVNPDP
jgi:hypothetical protein